MRLGLLADIHEGVEPLRAAVRELTARRVDAFVMLGDVLDAGARAEETVAVLAALPGLGVWGNHDFGLCGDVGSAVGQFSPSVLEYFARLRPWAELDGCRFQHIDPGLDPASITDLWAFQSPSQRLASFRTSGWRRAFMGHLHAWQLYSDEQPLTWQGESELRLEPERSYLTVVHAVIHGWCALLDTTSDTLEPVRVA